jgi:hypothetical protein
LILDGVPDRDDVFGLSSFKMLSVAYCVVGLPEPVGPVTRIVPFGFR